MIKAEPTIEGQPNVTSSATIKKRYEPNTYIAAQFDTAHSPEKKEKEQKLFALLAPDYGGSSARPLVLCVIIVQMKSDLSVTAAFFALFQSSA